MLTAARLREDVRPAGLDWITALRAPQVKTLVRDGDLQLTLFDRPGPGRDHLPGLPRRAAGGLQEPVPGSRAGPQARMRCWPPPRPTWTRSPQPARGPARPLRGKDKIAVRANRVLRRRKVAKHFTVEITDDSLSYTRDQDSITAEAKLDGIYVLRTSVPPVTWTAPRSSPPTRPWPRSSGPSAPSTPTWTSVPIRHPPRTASGRTCSCGCCRTTSAGTCRPGSRPSCSPTTTSPPPRPPGPARSPPPPAHRAPWPKPPPSRPPTTCPCTASPPCSSDLGTICLNTIAPADPALPGFRLVTTPTALQRQAFELLGVSHRLGAA